MGEPKLRFKADDGSEFPDWEDKTLGELFTFVTEKNKDSHINNVITNSAERGLVPQREYFDKDIAVDGNTKGYTVIRKGDFVYNPRKSASAPFGPFNIYERDEVGIVSPLYTCLTPYDDEMAPYLSWYFKTNRWHPYIVTHGAQSGARHDRVGMTVALMEGIPVLLPSLPEQRKIADFLSAVDAVIAAQQAEVDAWEQRKKGVMQKLFGQEVRFRADDGSDFPDWEEKTLGEEGQFYGGLSGKGKDDFDCGNGRFVTYMNVYKNTFASRDAMGRVKVGDTEKQNKVRYGDILFTQSSETVDEVGLSSVYLYNDEPYLNSFCMGYRFNNLDNVCPEFIGYCMRSNEIRKSIMLMGQGISRINLGAKRLATVKYKIPSLSEQRKIADCLASMDEVIQKSKDELAKWQELKKGLLQQMFM